MPTPESVSPTPIEPPADTYCSNITLASFGMYVSLNHISVLGFELTRLWLGYRESTHGPLHKLRIPTETETNLTRAKLLEREA